MAYTNGQLVRREIGDGGLFLRQAFSGDASTTRFRLDVSAVIADSEVVTVGGVSKSSPADYTLDPETGTIDFVAAPAAGTENIVVHYRGVEVSDGDITEALRQKGLDSTATADIGPATAILEAGYMLAQWVAAKYAHGYDSTIDGQSLSRSQRAKQWQDRAKDLLERISRTAGLRATAVVRVDGHNRDLIDSWATNETGENPRQRFYHVGGLDRVP